MQSTDKKHLANKFCTIYTLATIDKYLNEYTVNKWLMNSLRTVHMCVLSFQQMFMADQHFYALFQNWWNSVFFFSPHNSTKNINGVKHTVLHLYRPYRNTTTNGWTLERCGAEWGGGTVPDWERCGWSGWASVRRCLLALSTFRKKPGGLQP